MEKVVLTEIWEYFSLFNLAVTSDEWRNANF